MLTTNELELLERLCGDPLLLDHEAASGVVLTDPPEEPEPAGVGAVPASPYPSVEAVFVYAGQLRMMPLPDGDAGVEELLGG
jgi:hypothetical protein